MKIPLTRQDEVRLMNRRDFFEQLGALASAPAVATLGSAFTKGACADDSHAGESVSTTAAGPLRTHPENGRYFTDGSGKAVYLTGSHTWANLQDQLSPAPVRKFDFPSYLSWMQSHGHNFMRGWVWEQAAWDNHTKEKLLVEPLPYPRTGSGDALDGQPKFDLSRFNEPYFRRLRSRVIQAGRGGIYVSVMLFEGFSVDRRGSLGGNPWKGHPYHRANNINGVDGDPYSSGSGRTIHTLALPAVTALQEAYVRKVVDTVNDLDNVLYEVGNEHYADSADWQYHVVRRIRACEAGKPKRHPIGITSGGGAPGRLPNAALFGSPADWISPRHEDRQPYRDNPPAADGSKVILADSDHLWGLGGSRSWVWKSFTRGLNPILMDPYEPLYGLETFPHWGPLNRRDNPLWAPIRQNMGYTLLFARRMNLAAMTPKNELASTQYCLANPSAEYLVYLPDRAPVAVDLSQASGPLAVEWFDPQTGKMPLASVVQGGAHRSFTSPLRADAVLYIFSHQPGGHETSDGCSRRVTRPHRRVEMG